MKVYQVNEAMGATSRAYTLLGEIEDGDDPIDVLRRRGIRLERLRSFVRFETHGKDGERRVFARGIA